MTEAAKSDEAKTDAAKTDLEKTDPAKTDPAKTDPAKTDPAKTGLAKTGAGARVPAVQDPPALPTRYAPPSAKAPAPAQAWSVRRPMLTGILTLAVLVGGFGVWSVMTTLSGAIIAPGQIEVEQNRQVVQHPDGGVVKEILVQEGSLVAAGDPLIRLDGTQIRSELSIVEGQYFEILARQGRLEAERDDATTIVFPDELTAIAKTNPEYAGQVEGQERLFAAREETLAQQVEQLGKRKDQITNQIDGIKAQSVALNTQLGLIQQELVNQQSLLDKGLAEASRVLSLQREEARLAGSVGELTASEAEALGRTTELDIEILKLRTARREEALTQLRDLGYRSLELAERRRSLAEQVDRLEIRAPVSGIVYGLQVTTPRAVIRAADPVLFLIPQDRPLVIAARVNPIDIDQVKIGQEVRIVFPTFSANTTPELSGTISQLSADAFNDEQSGVSFYRAEIVLAPGDIGKLAGLTLIPGMPVEAFIRTADRTPLTYLVQPFTDYFKRAFRES